MHNILTLDPSHTDYKYAGIVVICTFVTKVAFSVKYQMVFSGMKMLSI